MGRLIAFDIGDKRIGIAVSSLVGDLAMPLETYFRKNIRSDIEYLVKIAEEKGADTIVCGLPVNFDGSESVQTVKTREFIDKLAEKTNIPIVTTDERFTTLEARRLLIEADMGRDKRKQVIDKVAASYILEGYMNRSKSNERK
ncbi:MAG: Holliday junction resolvase RuvX [Clostridia bacterium]|nr:Holliday junction resolvase RuvX [Clostridia bacterium]